MQANIRIPDGPVLSDPETPTETGGGTKSDGSRTSGPPKPKEEP
jgi:hypothetical protein